MGLQEGLILLGVAVFLLILLDALRRKRAAARRDFEDHEDPEEQARREQLARELPGLDDPDVKKTRKDLDPLFDDIDIFDDDPIPVLRKSVQLDEEPEQQATPESFDDWDEPFEEQEPPASPMTVEEVRRLFERDPEFDAEARRSAQEISQQVEAATSEIAETASVQETVEPKEPEEVYQDLVDIEPPAVSDPVPVESHEEPPLEEPAAEPQFEPEAPEPEQEEVEDLRTSLLVSLEQLAWGKAEEFLTININARADLPFEGHKLAYLMDMIGMQLSASGFFHYVDDKSEEPVLGYSMVNMFSPGTFNKETLDDFSTHGVVLVMALPNSRKPQAIFERMLETARVFERNWGAELQDEQRSNLTLQTIEHYRQRIQEFERKTRLKEIKAQKANK
ncbi:cell division protein ZipA [Marinospirillum celere]|uniref:Cell division protein ZipA n=1 Tax=Marinospirillum celere TaxID=1122252 RepID=A0A1I1H3U3_9GAMM|nr:cell division protein ZipA C-terminal FtsZ-binding domain-containing protein [Marinospirillum celere]SFC16768.1 cell division protein ZipA [Marinospirillum celere]